METKPEYVRFSCPGCNKRLKASAEDRGRRTRCSRCGCSFDIVPLSPPAGDPRELDWWDAPPEARMLAEVASEPDYTGPILKLPEETFAPKGSVHHGIKAAVFALLFAATALTVLLISALQEQKPARAVVERQRVVERTARAPAVQTQDKDEYPLPVKMLFATLLVGFYLVPSVIAFCRWHQDKAAILALNVLLGWTVLVWVAALVWSFTEVRSRHHYHYYRG